MKGRFNIVNIVLVIILILLVIFNYAIEHRNTIIINEYNTEILAQKNIISNLRITNDLIDINVNSLVDSINQLRELAIQYEDSIVKINTNYEQVIEEIYVLSDSLSVIHFRMLTSKYGDRFGYDLDR